MSKTAATTKGNVLRALIPSDLNLFDFASLFGACEQEVAALVIVKRARETGQKYAPVSSRAFQSASIGFGVEMMMDNGWIQSVGMRDGIMFYRPVRAFWNRVMRRLAILKCKHCGRRLDYGKRRRDNTHFVCHYCQKKLIPLKDGRA